MGRKKVPPGGKQLPADDLLRLLHSQNLGKIRTVIKAGLDPNGLIDNTSCFDNTTWVLRDRKPVVPLLVFACFNGVPAPVLDLLIKLGASPNAVTDCGLPAPLAVLCAKVTTEEQRALFQVLKQHRCSTFNTLVRSARNDEPIHLTSKLLDLSDWTSPRKVDGVELLIQFGTFELPGGGLDERALYEFVAMAVRYPCGHKLLDCLWRHFPQQLLPRQPVEENLLLRALADSWLDPAWRHSEERQHTVTMGVVLRTLLEHPSIQQPEREAVALWLRANMTALLYRPELVASLLDRTKTLHGNSSGSGSSNGQTRGSPSSASTGAGVGAGETSAELIAAGGVPLVFSPDDRDLVLPVGLLGGPAALQGDAPLAAGMSLMLAYAVDPDEHLAKQGVEMLLARGARVDLPCRLGGEVLGEEGDGSITPLVAALMPYQRNTALLELLWQRYAESNPGQATTDAAARMRNTAQAIFLGLPAWRGALDRASQAVANAAAAAAATAAAGGGSAEGASHGAGSAAAAAAAAVAATLPGILVDVNSPFPCSKERLRELLDSSVLDFVDARNLDQVEAVLLELLGQLTPSAAAAQGPGAADAAADAPARAAGEAGPSSSSSSSAAAAAGGPAAAAAQERRSVREQLAMVSERLEDEQTRLDALYGSGRSDAEVDEDPEVWGAEAKVEALAAVQRCLLRAVESGGGGGGSTSASATAGSAAVSSERDAAFELHPGIAFVEVVAARIMSQPEWGFSRGLLLQLGVCQMRRMLRATQAEGDEAGAASLVGQMQVLRLHYEGLLAGMAAPERQLLVNLVRALEEADEARAREEEEAGQEEEGQAGRGAGTAAAGAKDGEVAEPVAVRNEEETEEEKGRAGCQPGESGAAAAGVSAGPAGAAFADPGLGMGMGCAEGVQGIALQDMFRAMLPGEALDDDDDDWRNGGDDVDDSDGTTAADGEDDEDIRIAAGEALTGSGQGDGATHAKQGCSPKPVGGGDERGGRTPSPLPEGQQANLVPEVADPSPDQHPGPRPQAKGEAGPQPGEADLPAQEQHGALSPPKALIHQTSAPRRRLHASGGGGARRRARREYDSDSGAADLGGGAEPPLGLGPGWEDPLLLLGLGGGEAMSVPPHVRHSNGLGSDASSESSRRELGSYEYLGAAVMLHDGGEGDGEYGERVRSIGGAGGKSSGGGATGGGGGGSGGASSSAYDTPSEGGSGDEASGMLAAQIRALHRATSGGGGAGSSAAAAAGRGADRRRSSASGTTSGGSYGSAEGGYGSGQGYGPEYGLESNGGDMGALGSASRGGGAAAALHGRGGADPRDGSTGQLGSAACVGKSRGARYGRRQQRHQSSPPPAGLTAEGPSLLPLPIQPLSCRRRGLLAGGPNSSTISSSGTAVGPLGTEHHRPIAAAAGAGGTAAAAVVGGSGRRRSAEGPEDSETEESEQRAELLQYLQRNYPGTGGRRAGRAPARLRDRAGREGSGEGHAVSSMAFGSTPAGGKGSRRELEGDRGQRRADCQGPGRSASSSGDDDGGKGDRRSGKSSGLRTTPGRSGGGAGGGVESDDTASGSAGSVNFVARPPLGASNLSSGAASAAAAGVAVLMTSSRLPRRPQVLGEERAPAGSGHCSRGGGSGGGGSAAPAAGCGGEGEGDAGGGGPGGGAAGGTLVGAMTASAPVSRSASSRGSSMDSTRAYIVHNTRGGRCWAGAWPARMSDQGAMDLGDGTCRAGSWGDGDGDGDGNGVGIRRSGEGDEDPRRAADPQPPYGHGADRTAAGTVRFVCGRDEDGSSDGGDVRFEGLAEFSGVSRDVRDAAGGQAASPSRDQEQERHQQPRRRRLLARRTHAAAPHGGEAAAAAAPAPPPQPCRVGHHDSTCTSSSSDRRGSSCDSDSGGLLYWSGGSAAGRRRGHAGDEATGSETSGSGGAVVRRHARRTVAARAAAGASGSGTDDEDTANSAMALRRRSAQRRAGPFGGPSRGRRRQQQQRLAAGSQDGSASSVNAGDVKAAGPAAAAAASGDDDSGASSTSTQEWPPRPRPRPPQAAAVAPGPAATAPAPAGPPDPSAAAASAVVASMAHSGDDGGNNCDWHDDDNLRVRRRRGSSEGGRGSEQSDPPSVGFSGRQPEYGSGPDPDLEPDTADQEPRPGLAAAGGRPRSSSSEAPSGSGSGSGSDSSNAGTESGSESASQGTASTAAAPVVVSSQPPGAGSHRSPGAAGRGANGPHGTSSDERGDASFDSDGSVTSRPTPLTTPTQAGGRQPPLPVTGQQPRNAVVVDAVATLHSGGGGRPRGPAIKGLGDTASDSAKPAAAATEASAGGAGSGSTASVVADVVAGGAAAGVSSLQYTGAVPVRIIEVHGDDDDDDDDEEEEEDGDEEEAVEVEEEEDESATGCSGRPSSPPPGPAVSSRQPPLPQQQPPPPPQQQQDAVPPGAPPPPPPPPQPGTADRSLTALLATLAAHASVHPRMAAILPGGGQAPQQGPGGGVAAAAAAADGGASSSSGGAAAGAGAAGVGPGGCGVTATAQQSYVLHLGGGTPGDGFSPPPAAVMRVLTSVPPRGADGLLSWVAELRSALASASGCEQQRVFVVADLPTRQWPPWLPALRTAVVAAVLGPVRAAVQAAALGPGSAGAGEGDSGGGAGGGGGGGGELWGWSRRHCPAWLRQAVALLPLAHLVFPHGGVYLYQAALQAHREATAALAAALGRARPPRLRLRLDAECLAAAVGFMEAHPGNTYARALLMRFAERQVTRALLRSPRYGLLGAARSAECIQELLCAGPDTVGVQAAMCGPTGHPAVPGSGSGSGSGCPGAAEAADGAEEGAGGGVEGLLLEDEGEEGRALRGTGLTFQVLHAALGAARQMQAVWRATWPGGHAIRLASYSYMAAASYPRAVMAAVSLCIPLMLEGVGDLSELLAELRLLGHSPVTALEVAEEVLLSQSALGNDDGEDEDDLEDSPDILIIFNHLVNALRSTAAPTAIANGQDGAPQLPQQLTPWSQLPATYRNALMSDMLAISEDLMIVHAVLLSVRTALVHAADGGAAAAAAAAGALRREVAEVLTMRAAASRMLVERMELQERSGTDPGGYGYAYGGYGSARRQPNGGGAGTSVGGSSGGAGAPVTAAEAGAGAGAEEGGDAAAAGAAVAAAAAAGGFVSWRHVNGLYEHGKTVLQYAADAAAALLDPMLRADEAERSELLVTAVLSHTQLLSCLHCLAAMPPRAQLWMAGQPRPPPPPPPPPPGNSATAAPPLRVAGSGQCGEVVYRLLVLPWTEEPHKSQGPPGGDGSTSHQDGAGGGAGSANNSTNSSSLHQDFERSSWAIPTLLRGEMRRVGQSRVRRLYDEVRSLAAECLDALARISPLDLELATAAAAASAAAAAMAASGGGGGGAGQMAAEAAADHMALYAAAHAAMAAKTPLLLRVVQEIDDYTDEGEEGAGEVVVVVEEGGLDEPL